MTRHGMWPCVGGIPPDAAVPRPLAFPCCHFPPTPSSVLQGLTLMDIEATQRLRARLRTPEAQARVHTGGCLPAMPARYAGWSVHGLATMSAAVAEHAEACCCCAVQGKAERLMDIVGTISHGRGATLGARQLWARMSGTMRRLRRALHALLQQVGGEGQATKAACMVGRWLCLPRYAEAWVAAVTAAALPCCCL